MHSTTPFYMTMRFRVLTGAILGIVLTLAMAAGVSWYMAQKGAAFYQQAHTEQEAHIEENLALHAKGYETFVVDYASREEVARFVKTKDATFAKENLEASLQTYNASVLWVYDPSGKQVYTARRDARPEADVAVAELSSGAAVSLFGEKQSVHFYAKTAAGIMELHGAPIRINTAAQKTPTAQGYLFAGRLLDQGYLQELSKSSRALIQLASTQELSQPITYSVKDGQFALYYPLEDAQGTAIAGYYAVVDAEYIKHVRQSLYRILLWMAGVYALTVLLYVILLAKWVLLPLNRVYSVLQNKDKSAINDLVSEQGEFGQVARMIAYFFDQQRDLTTEVLTQRETQAKLEKQTHELERMNSLMVGRELKMAELKRQNAELEKHLEELRHE